MLFLLKTLLGVATVGGGIVLPIAITQSGTSTTLESRLGKVGESLGQTTTRLVSSLLETRRQEFAKDRENSKFAEAFGDLIEKGCKLVQNPAGSKDDFHALYACKKAKTGPTSFYYLGSRDTVKISGREAIKLVDSVDYEGQEREGAQLALNFKGEEQPIRLNVMKGEGGWSYFKGVNLSEKCSIETKQLGGDDLRCELKDTTGKTFFYNFSIFN